MQRDKAGWLSCNFAAALLKLELCAEATKACSWAVENRWLDLAFGRLLAELSCPSALTCGVSDGVVKGVAAENMDILA